MKGLKRNILCFGLVILVMGAFFPSASFAAVTVSMECAYTDSDLACYIYADTGGDSLISAGVMVSYNTTELSSPVCTKNDNEWYFGDPAGTKYPYMDPEVDTTNGNLVYIVGKLDTITPSAGVNKARALIGKVTFTRTSSTNPGADPAAFFGLGVTEGRVDPFANFVNTAGTELDSGISYSMKVAKRGDANADGVITNLDMFAIRSLLSGGSYVVYADCNNDGVLTNLDMFCVRGML